MENRLRPDTQILFYFKFPPAFKVHFPKVIGNYNPDWGIVRYDERGRVTLQLIRETKGTQDKTKLQFPQERRKIECPSVISKRFKWITGTLQTTLKPGGSLTMPSSNSWKSERLQRG